MHQIAVSFVMGLADGPTEVHKVTVAKQVLRGYHPTNDLFPAYSLLSARERALQMHPELEELVAAEIA
jgi:acyl-CoA dehydrogenase